MMVFHERLSVLFFSVIFSVLLSAVSGEDTQDRTDRLLLTPWVKFLWESYRQCLDLLRNNSKVERLYHDIAQQAFKFCLQYTRKAEFRKLCDNLRMHLGQIQRHHNQSTAINMNNPESQSMHLETRLVQLDSAISMELWQEAFKAVEDIHGLFALSKKPPKPQLMANYYNKVSTVFWKSGNALFHACTLHRLYHLSREMRKNLTQEEMQRMSTRVLLATLSIPITPERTDIARLLDMDGIIVEKHRRLATLLGLQSPPTRQSLINDMVRFNLLQYVVPEVKELYNWLEVDFHPLKLCGRVTKLLNWVRDQAEKESDLLHYVPHLQNNTILRLLQQVAQIYQSIEFNRLASLVPFVDAFQLERSIVDAARHCDLQVRIDHTSRTLSFGSDLNYSTKEDSPVGPFLQNMPSEQIRNQLTAMSSSLAKAIQVIKPVSMLQEHEEQSQQAITAYLKNARKEHQRILARRQTIEERKERLESLNIQREKEELEQREAELQKVRKAEEDRLRQEAKEREKERIMQEHEQIKKKTVRERLEQIKKTELGAKAFKDIDIEDLEELDPDFIMAKQVEQLEKEKKELQERLKNQEKKEQERKQRARQLEIEERERRKEEERKAPEEKPSKDWGEREEGGWRKRGEGDSEWRRPVGDRDWRQEGREGREDNDREDREMPFRRGGESSRRGGSDDRGLRRGFDDERGPRRGGDDDRGPRRGFDDDRGPRRGFDDDRGYRRADDDRGPRRGMDDDHGPRRGFDDDRGPRRGMDEPRGPRRGADDDWGPRRGGDDERGGRRGMDDSGPRRGDDPRPWKPLERPGASGWREREKAREESWGPPRDTGHDDGEREGDDRHEGDRFRDRRPPREEGGGWRRGGGAEEQSSWRDSRREDFDRDDRRERRDMRDRRDDRDQDRDHRAPDEGGSWRRGGEERKDEREAPPRPHDRDRDGGERSTWRSDKDKEIQRRTKNETDDDGWTTVRR
uniref:eIF3 p167 n=1 Tax=Cyprinus carpio TaxID=7962 RepID=A0A8C1S822_CYPCA